MIFLKDNELAKIILEEDNIQELLSREEILEKLNDPVFEKYLYRYLRAGILASIPRIIYRLILEAQDGKTASAKLLFELYSKIFQKEVTIEDVSVDELQERIKEILNESRT